MKASRKVRRTAQHLFRLCLVDGRLDPTRVRGVAARVAASRQRGSIAVLTGFRRLVRLDRERHHAVVESATALPDDLRAAVRANLVARYGDDLDTLFSENPALIAGMRIRVGSDVYDGSVRAKLAAIDAGLSE
jgi:F-type H+-transporting ATPase subunit delta